MLAGPFLVGACARSAVEAPFWPNCSSRRYGRTAAVPASSTRGGGGCGDGGGGGGGGVPACSLRSENCPLVQPLWWQQLQLLLWTLCTSSLRCWLSELGYACQLSCTEGAQKNVDGSVKPLQTFRPIRAGGLLKPLDGPAMQLCLC